ncbi:ATP-dependent Clp protease adaptor protein ClpS [Abyssogena phaseoliformis symbiont OG214]|uniref:ATP-dependent Clp protease adapter ClpS n=1 Tax=Abyssogena phaseoliformis symbiont TaxID=596095 RepID=UPI00191551AF|nr:ATP-dependent Clp protease adapter ClpS [Abyssogena phaseoliformis symbiont]MBW5289753.1 ATP-dependent Clp protease adaptor protein ClpS [Candidatus Ruthia sp. Apha_13_S6]BBB23036.1 ATP-dependent Clp protease adaptor protein ClpS [Abyssogena phaseoliformis symbiont OG214]
MTKILTQTSKPKLKKPNKFQVLLLNDDYTTMEFVINVLVHFFSKSEEAAQAIMFKIHIEGEGICGIFSHDIAQTKVTQVIEFARKNEQPLMCVLRELEI